MSRDGININDPAPDSSRPSIPPKAPPQPPRQIHAGGIVSRDEQQALVELDAAICKAIDDAKAAGVPQGLIVATLHGHAAAQTLIMIEN